MKLGLPDAELCLSPARFVRLHEARGTRIRCVVGCLWITVTGSAEDVFLRDGDSFKIPAPGLVLIEALVASRLVLDLAEPLLEVA